MEISSTASTVNPSRPASTRPSVTATTRTAGNNRADLASTNPARCNAADPSRSEWNGPFIGVARSSLGSASARNHANP